MISNGFCFKFLFTYFYWLFSGPFSVNVETVAYISVNIIPSSFYIFPNIVVNTNVVFYIQIFLCFLQNSKIAFLV